MLSELLLSLRKSNLKETLRYNLVFISWSTLAENGKVLVTGCLCAKKDEIIELHLNVLGVTDPYIYDEVLTQVHEHVRKLNTKHYLIVNIVH